METLEYQKERYLRHIMLEDVGWEGQKKLHKASVLVIGAGGLGSPVCLYLAAAGIGEIGLCDSDVVDRSNLQRQVIHTTQDINIPKVYSAKYKMESINPNIKVNTHFERLTSKNAVDLFKEYSFIVDATDNFASKYMINDAAILADRPLSHAGVLKYRGQTMTIIPRKTACFSCVFSEPPGPETKNIFIAGLLGVTPGILGIIQSSEVIKYFLGVGDLLENVLLTVDVKTANFRKVSLKRDLKCTTCGKNGITELGDYPI